LFEFSEFFGTDKSIAKNMRYQKQEKSGIHSSFLPPAP